VELSICEIEAIRTEELMSNPIELDKAFSEFIHNLPKWVPEGIIDVDLDLLQSMGLLHTDEYEDSETPDELPHYFHVVETSEKVTLFNHQFAIWIVPQIVDELPITIVLISLLTTGTPHLEVVFSTKGVYNTPKFVLKVLKYYLSEVIDNEEAISSIRPG